MSTVLALWFLFSLCAVLFVLASLALSSRISAEDGTVNEYVADDAVEIDETAVSDDFEIEHRLNTDN